MRVISINLNGIRYACSKDWLPWLAQQEVDIVCVQELKANPNSSAALLGTTPPLTSNGLFKSNPSAKYPQAKPLAEAEHFA